MSLIGRWSRLPGSASPRTPALIALFGLALLALGSGSVFIARSARGSPPVVVGAIRPVDPEANRPLDISAHNSPTLARDPRRSSVQVVVSRIDTPLFSCSLFISTDTGQTWMERIIPFPSGEETPPRCYAPDAVFGADGTLYLSFVTLKGLGNTPHAVWVAASVDNGQTFSFPVRASGPLAFQVRLSIDTGSPGHLYLSWLQASATGTLLFPETGNPVVVARSDDGAKTWSQPRVVSPPARQRVVAPSATVGAGGRLYVLYLDLGDDVLDYSGGHGGQGGPPYPGHWELVLARSDNRGATWTETVVERALVPTQRFIVFLPPSPSLAVDTARGKVYVGFHDGRLGDPDVYVWASADAGVSFGPARRVNDTPIHDGSDQYLPRLAVSPNGRLDVLYYDRREDDANVANQVSMQSSTDGGRRFGPRLRVSDRAFDSRIGFGSERGLPDLGSRLALLSADDRAWAVWTDTRAGTQASNKQDLGRAVVRFHSASTGCGPVLLAGETLAGAGMVLLGAAGWAAWQRQ